MDAGLHVLCGVLGQARLCILPLIGLSARVRHALIGHVFGSVMQARSSGVEHHLDMVGVGGSKPPVPTRFNANEKDAIVHFACA